MLLDYLTDALALGIVHDEQVVHLAHFGTADQTGQAVTAQTPFVLGSTSQPCLSCNWLRRGIWRLIRLCGATCPGSVSLMSGHRR